MESNFYSDKSEHLYLKLCAAQELLNNAKNPDDINCIISIIKKIQKDIESSGDNNLIEKARALIISDNDADVATIKKGIPRILLCVLVAIVSMVVAVIGYNKIHSDAINNEKNRREVIEREFRDEFDQKLEAIRTGYALDEYHIKSITYDITNIKLFSGSKGLIYVSIDATYDSAKYNNILGTGSDNITFEFEQLCWNYKFESSGWNFEVVETSTVNGGRGKYSSGNEEPYWADGRSPYKEPDSSWIALLLGVVVAIGMVIIIVQTKKQIDRAKYNMRGKTKLVRPKGSGKKFLTLLIVIIVAAGVVASSYFLVQQNQQKKAEAYSQAEEHFVAKDYEIALSEYQNLGNYSDSEQKARLIQSIQSKDYDNAITICDSLDGDYAWLRDSLVEEQTVYYYEQASTYFNDKSFDEAKKYYDLIPGYKDADDMSAQMGNYSKYYEALEYESESVVGAVEIYKTLPSDFLDVGDRIEKYEPYLACVGTTFGNPNGYITDGIKITDYSVNSDGKMVLHTWNLDAMVIDRPTKSGYLFSVTDSKYGRTWNVSEDMVSITIDGKDCQTWYK